LISQSRGLGDVYKRQSQSMELFTQENTHSFAMFG
jgi:hypothetical protein